MADYSKKTRDELVIICKKRGIKGYSGKKKVELVAILSSETAPTKPPDKICRLSYIGSKFQLLEWISTTIKEKTGWTSFKNKTIADIFAGTGIVSFYFRNEFAKVISNDAELYSSIITHAFSQSVFTDNCKKVIENLNQTLSEGNIGFITTHYSPYNSNERKFFTIENAKRIDYCRNKLEETKKSLTDDEYKFILASIIISADTVSNVPAVYGCFLKNFKAKALKQFVITPIHTLATLPVVGSYTTNSDVLNIEYPKTDIVYLDPPYNERQYSKNYFPLNIIAKTPTDLLTEAPLKGKTGIPTDCFISPFCKKGMVENAFDSLFSKLNTCWVFMSYSSEAIVPKDKMVEIMEKYGNVSVVECDYKRFKSFEYNEDVAIKEYLFCLEINNS
jgi:adenine-specific DNA-methyltransferase